MAVTAVMDGVTAVGTGHVLARREGERGKQSKDGSDEAHEEHLICRVFDCNPLT